jgi:hypothetical protein
MDDDSGVVDPVPVPQRCAHQQHRQQVGRRGHDIRQGPFDGVEQAVLHQDVVDGVAAQRQLREHRQRDAVVVAVTRERDHRFGVRHGIGERGVVGAGGHPDEAVLVGGIEVHAAIVAK